MHKDKRSFRKYHSILYYRIIALLFCLFFTSLTCSPKPSNLPDNQNTTEPTIEENNNIKEEELYKELWRFTAKEEFTSTPVISEGKVIFVGISRHPKMDNFVYAVDQKTGSLVWEHKLETRSNHYIAESQGLVFVGCNEKLVALDAKTGNTKWEFSDDPEGYPHFTYPVIYDDTVIICKKNPVYVENKDCIFVLDALSGAVKWKKRIDGSLQSNFPVVTNGLLCYETNAPNWKGQIFAVDMFTGQEKWSYQASAVWLDQPVANEQVVCFQLDENELIALDALTGQEKWQFTPDKEKFLQTTPFISAELVYLSVINQDKECFLLALDSYTGKEKWRSPPYISQFNSISVLLNNTIYVSSDYFGFISALDAKSGDRKWIYYSGDASEINESIISKDNILYFTCNRDNEGSVLIALQDLSQQK